MEYQLFNKQFLIGGKLGKSSCIKIENCVTYSLSGDGHGGSGWLESFVSETQKDGHLFFHSGISNCLTISCIMIRSRGLFCICFRVASQFS